MVSFEKMRLTLVCLVARCSGRFGGIRLTPVDCRRDTMLRCIQVLLQELISLFRTLIGFFTITTHCFLPGQSPTALRGLARRGYCSSIFLFLTRKTVHGKPSSSRNARECQCLISNAPVRMGLVPAAPWMESCGGPIFFNENLSGPRVRMGDPWDETATK